MNPINNADQFDGNLFESLFGSDLDRRRAEVRLFKKYFYMVNMGQTKYMLSCDDSVDAYSDAMLAVMHSITSGKFQGTCSVKTYVYQIFHNKCVDLIRRKTAQKNLIHNNYFLIDAAINLPDSAVSVLDKFAAEAELKTVREKLGSLCKNHRDILLLFAEGYSDREIATMSKYNSPDVVKTCRLRSIRKMRIMMGKPTVCS